jgi:cytochrome c oxidase subunit 2
VDHEYDLTLYATGAIFVLTQLGLAYAVFRFRDRGQCARFTRGNIAMEVLCTSATVLIFLGLGILGRKAWAEVRFTEAAADAIQIEVTESQFQFYFRYPGADRTFGRLDPAFVSPAIGNPPGLDPNDAAGKDDIVASATLTVPVNHEIELLIRSQDVIHNFFVRELRLQQDAVPGLIVPLHFTPNKIGQFEIVCTQLCGLGHFRMHSSLNVVFDADYQDFLKQQAVSQ